ncbi:UDP-N-acetylglucosamine 2-epimerase [Halomonas sp. KAO]|uniref:UDP-N-acetylglucosamine 2-epimerase n=1 Tax=Halomonas sp. KAO TaxID=2783858 RepID=UPI002B4C0257|nr:UDP-N-acetylglucosamine 2-epimerase [Halomonas sp. KAO]
MRPSRWAATASGPYRSATTGLSKSRSCSISIIRLTGNESLMPRILTIIGARPQFIKASVVSRAIAQTDGIEEIVLHTGQHFDANMSDIFFNQLGMPRPDVQLNIHGNPPSSR